MLPTGGRGLLMTSILSLRASALCKQSPFDQREIAPLEDERLDLAKSGRGLTMTMVVSFQPEWRDPPWMNAMRGAAVCLPLEWRHTQWRNSEERS
jgi:hypothetical protein